MYTVITIFEQNKRKHYVIDEYTNEIVGTYFTRKDKAERLKIALNRELRRKKCKNFQYKANL